MADLVSVKRDRLYGKDRNEFYPITTFEYIIDASNSGYDAIDESVGFRAIRNNLGKVIDSSTPSSGSQMRLVMSDGTRLYAHDTSLGSGNNTMSFLSQKGEFVSFSSTYFTVNSSTGAIDANVTAITDACEKTANKETSIGASSSDGKYPTTTAVINYAQDKNKLTTSITSTSTDEEYPSAKSVYDFCIANSPDIIIQEVTYAQLKNMIDSSSLRPGRSYRITDYVTDVSVLKFDEETSEYSIDYDYSSAGNQFDLIVFADSSSQISSEAHAVKHDGSTYFDNTDFSKWVIKYDINNDRTKYNWANPIGGKGVIYYMKDEFNNECYYDFKNIVLNTSDNDDSSCYTFSIIGVEGGDDKFDLSKINSVRNNSIFSNNKNELKLPGLFIVIKSFSGFTTSNVTIKNNKIGNSLRYYYTQTDDDIKDVSIENCVFEPSTYITFDDGEYPYNIHNVVIGRNNRVNMKDEYVVNVYVEPNSFTSETDIESDTNYHWTEP